MLKIELKNYLKGLNDEELYEILYLLIFKGNVLKAKTFDKYFDLKDFIKYLTDNGKILYKNKNIVIFEDFWSYIQFLFKDVSFYDFFTFCGQAYGVTKAQIIKDLFVFFIDFIEEDKNFDTFFKFISENGFSLKNFEDAIMTMHSSSISASKKSTYEMVESHNFSLILNTNILHKNLKVTLKDYNELIENIELVECLLEDEDEVSRLAILKIKEKINEILYK